MGELVEGIDEAWLAGALGRDPVHHAYAAWDLRRFPDRVRLVSYRQGGSTRAYRLEWQDPRGPPMVHWVGPADAAGLLEGWPPRPFTAVVPGIRVVDLAARRGPIRQYPVQLRARPPRPPPLPPAGPARRLGRDDLDALAAWVRSDPEPMLRGYEGVDPEATPCFGAFVEGALTAVARAAVVLPEVWVLNGIVTRPERRGRGLGRAVTAAAVGAAEAGGARCALYVRSDNAPAVRLYERLGFEIVDDLVWVDAGADRPP